MQKYIMAVHLQTVAECLTVLSTCTGYASMESD